MLKNVPSIFILKKWATGNNNNMLKLKKLVESDIYREWGTYVEINDVEIAFDHYLRHRYQKLSYDIQRIISKPISPWEAFNGLINYIYKGYIPDYLEYEHCFPIPNDWDTWQRRLRGEPIRNKRKIRVNINKPELIKIFRNFIQLTVKDRNDQRLRRWRQQIDRQAVIDILQTKCHVDVLNDKILYYLWLGNVNEHEDEINEINEIMNIQI